MKRSLTATLSTILLAAGIPLVVLVAAATPAAAGQQPGATITLNVNPGAVTTFAGSGSNANTDGTGTAASFRPMGGIAVVGSVGYVLTDDYIRRVDLTTGQVTTLAGNPSIGLCQSGNSGSQSSFGNPATSLDTDGTYLYTAATCWGGYVRKTSIATGATSIVAALTHASYLTYGPDGYLYATEGSSSASVFKIDPATGTTSTFATLPSGVSGAYAITSDGSSLWVVAQTTSSTQRIYQVAVSGATVSLLASGSDFGTRALTSAGDYLYGAAGTSSAIRRYAKSTGTLTNVAGAGSDAGFANGTGTDAWFNSIGGLVSDGSNLWVSDSGNYRLRRVVPGSALPSTQPSALSSTLFLNPASVTTFAGSGANATTDGTGTAASFSYPSGMAVSGNALYVRTSAFIRKVDLATSQVTTLAGVANPQFGCGNGPSGASSTFNGLPDMIVTDGWYLYDATTCLNQVRRTSIATGATSTIAPLPGAPNGIAYGPDGYLYVTTGKSIIKIDRINGTTSTFATLPSDISTATAIASDSTALWVVAYVSGSSQRIYRIAIADASQSLLVGGSDFDTTVLASAGDDLYGASTTGLLRRFAKADGSSANVAGSAGGCGYQDGAGTAAWFCSLRGIVSDGTNLWVADFGNYRIRRVVAVKQAGIAGGPTRPSEALGAGNPSEPHQCDCQQATADPVNTATGNFYESYNDIAIPGRGVALDFNHTYNSLSSGQDSALGYGWRHSYAISLTPNTFEPAGSYDVNQENGSQVTFKPDGSGGYTTAPRVLASLVHNGDGTFTFTRRAREKYVFDAGGKLIREVDLNGYTTTLTYNGSAQLTTITDPAGRALTLTWTGSRVTSITDAASRSVSFAYDQSGNLTDVTDVGSGNTHFTYDANHLLLTVRDPNANTVTTNTYDSSRRVLTQKDALNRQTNFGYSPTATTVTDPKGNVTVQNYQDGELASMTKGYGTPQAATWTYGYDQNTLGLSSVTDPLNHTTSSTYDAAGNLLTKTDALNRVTTNTYDVLNDLTSVTDPKNVTTTLSYDSAGNLLTRSTPLVGSNPAQSQTVTATYADVSHPGDVTSTIDPNGKVSTYTYDAYGNRTSATDPLGNKTISCYDAVGRTTKSIAAKGSAAGVTCTSSSPAAYTTYFTTDAFGDILTTTDPLGHQVAKTYDADRNVKTSTDADSHQTTYTYDAANQLTTTTRPDTTTLTNDYWPDGMLHHQYDSRGNATTYAYDAAGRLTSVTDPLSRITTYGYDGAGNRTSMADPGNQTTTWTYDAANQLTAITYSDGVTPNVTNVTYDADGQRTAMTDGTGTSAWAWDSLHRMTSATNGAGATVGYGYDIKGQLTSLVYPGTTGTVTRTYDDAGRLQTVADWLSNTTTFTYDADGNLTTQAYPNGTTATYTPDGADRLMAISHAPTASPNSPFASFTYVRDNANLLTSVSSTGVPSDNHTYTYTALSQLQGADSASYAYDTADNLTQLTNGTTQAFDAANQLCWMAPSTGSSCATPPSGATTFTYDSRGNRTTVTPPSGPATTLAYDQANRLTAYGTNTTYSYDGDGLRAAKTVSATANNFTWDVAEGLPSLLVDGTTDYVYGPDGLPLEQVSSGSVLYYHHDQLGSTRALTDASGTVDATYSYDSYGKLSGSTGTIANPFGYAGQYTDAESGLIYMRARYYDPATAQFLTRDPLVILTQDAYGYSGDDPLNLTDPSGLASHFSNQFKGWGLEDFEQLSCDELMKIMNGLMHELHTRDVDFKKNTYGFNYNDKDYNGHVYKYRSVQNLLELAQQAYENNGCDLTDKQATMLDFYETKDPDPLGHPGRKPHKSVFQQIVDHTTLRIPGLGIRVPDLVEVA